MTAEFHPAHLRADVPFSSGTSSLRTGRTLPSCFELEPVPLSLLTERFPGQTRYFFGFAAISKCSSAFLACVVPPSASLFLPDSIAAFRWLMASSV